jgi:hypothetical protein
LGVAEDLAAKVSLHALRFLEVGIGADGEIHLVVVTHALHHVEVIGQRGIDAGPDEVIDNENFPTGQSQFGWHATRLPHIAPSYNRFKSQMIFVISDTLEKAEKILPETFVGLNIWERTHIEEWVRLNPDLLGEDLLILTTEFDRFYQQQ